MAKQRNSNIGHMVCPLAGCSTQAAVRRNVSGKLYCDCPDHGRLTPNLPAGQDLIMDQASIWGAGQPPADCARWIAEQWPWGRVMRDPQARVPVNGASPVNEGDPVNEGRPLTDPPAQPEPAPVNRGAPPPPPGPAKPAPVKQAPPATPEPEPEPETTTTDEDDWR